jgi:hypothetical protein
MKKNRILIIILIVIIIALAALISFGGYFFQFRNTLSKQNSQFPPSNVQCFDSFMNAVNSGYANGFKIPAFNFSDISYFRCASHVGFNQYEISGTDKEGHSFYIHKDEGGMAASGADSVYNLCYKKDNVILNNEKINGRDSVKKTGTCFWTDNFPLNPTSTYEYTPK